MKRKSPKSQKKLRQDFKFSHSGDFKDRFSLKSPGALIFRRIKSYSWEYLTIGLSQMLPDFAKADTVKALNVPMSKHSVEYEAYGSNLSLEGQMVVPRKIWKG